MGKVNLDKKYARIIKERINRKSRSKDPLTNALNKFWDAEGLIDTIHKKIKNKRLVQEARRQFVVTSVTSIEVLLKDYFVKLLSLEGVIEKFPEYSDKKFSVEDINYLEAKDISDSEIICGYYNFQNMSDINSAFSTALSSDFFEDLREYKWWFNKKDKKTGFMVLGDFYRKLDKVISLRNDFVHDINFKFRLFRKEIEDIDTFLITFMTQLSFFMSERIQQLKNKKPKK